MKILFYDVKKVELDYFLDKISSKIEPYFFKNSLNNSTYVDEKYLDCEGLSVFVSSELDREVLKKFKNLKYIFLRCVGFSNVDIEYCKTHDIKIFNTPNYGNSTVAEHVFTLVLAISKNLLLANDMINNGNINHEEIIGVELNKKTLGIIGLGGIGRRVASIAAGFGMEVIAFDNVPKGNHNFVELDELFKKSDFITLNCPLTDETRNLINKKTISKMKKSAFLINCARGEIINTKDLYEALIKKQIKGAALDVVECEEFLCFNHKNCEEKEDLKDKCLKKFFFIQKIIKLDNVIITPHIAYNTIEARHRILKITQDNINSIIYNLSSAKNLVLI